MLRLLRFPVLDPNRSWIEDFEAGDGFFGGDLLAGETRRGGEYLLGDGVFRDGDTEARLGDFDLRNRGDGLREYDRLQRRKFCKYSHVTV